MSIYIFCFSGFKDDYDIQCTRETSIDVTTGVDFTHRPPQDTQLNVAEIINMRNHQSVSILTL